MLILQRRQKKKHLWLLRFEVKLMESKSHEYMSFIPGISVEEWVTHSKFHFLAAEAKVCILFNGYMSQLSPMEMDNVFLTWLLKLKYFFQFA